MFTKNEYSECIGNTIISSKAAQSARNPDDVTVSAYPGYITIPAEAAGANAVLVQVFFDPAEVTAQGISLDDTIVAPLVTIDEYNDYVGVPAANINKGYATPGMKLLNYGNFLIETGKNISNAKIIPFNENINVYIALNYYK